MVLADSSTPLMVCWMALISSGFLSLSFLICEIEILSKATLSPIQNYYRGTKEIMQMTDFGKL